MATQHPLVIAIDGPAASGKGTIAREIARFYGFPCLDTGLLYRAVGHQVLEKGYVFEDMAAIIAIAHHFSADWLENDQLRSEEASIAASRVAAIPEVRRALRQFQQDFAKNPPKIEGKPAKGAVLDGRDIGTVICPQADVKLWVTALPHIRAYRRFKELQDRGIEVNEEDVFLDLLARDERDAPNMIKAADAHLLDTSGFDKETTIRCALELVAKCLSSKEAQKHHG